LSQIQWFFGGFILKIKSFIRGDERYSEDGFIGHINPYRIYINYFLLEPEMAKAPAKKPKPVPAKKLPVKKVEKKTGPIDYFKYPFEVYYSDELPVTSIDLKSDVDKCKRFKDIKIAHMEQGGSYGVVFFCSKNKGPELYCALTNSHDEMAPPWYSVEEEESTDFNYGCDYAIKIEGGEIKFVDPTDEQMDEDSEEYLDQDAMIEFCYGFYGYHIEDSGPDYIILDALDTKVKIDLEGYALDDDGERIESQRIINVDELDGEKYEGYETRSFYEAKREWIKSVLEKDFPKDKKLFLSPKSQ